MIGRRMPDLDLTIGPDRSRVFALLGDGRPLLLNFGRPGTFEGSPGADRVRVVDAGHDGGCRLPVLGEVTLPTAVAVRPDGHVVWAGDPGDPGLPPLLTRWFGSPERSRTRSAT
jgi:3-(3-hydroxy-phenyl)propionate hydroxylase